MIAEKPAQPSLEKAFRDLIESRRIGFQKELVRVGEEWTPDSIHDLRVACRRFRSALRAFSPYLEPLATQPLSTALKGFMQEFNSLRDVDVQLEMLEKLPVPIQPTLRNRLAEVVVVFRSRKKILDEKLKEFVRNNTQVGAIGLPPLLTSGLPTLKEGVRAVLETELGHAVAQSRNIPWELPSETLEPLHDLRIQFKRLRYGVELFAPFLGREVPSLLKVFKHLQDLLGWIHDLDVLAASVKKLWREQARDRQRLIRTMVRELPWPLPSSFDPLRRPRPVPKDHQKAYLYILGDLSIQRAGHYKTARSLLRRLEALDWAETLPQWFARGTCPANWKKEFANHAK